MINKLKNEKGITLIALVVTIIVILILAFISLSLVLGQDGLFKKASDAGKLQKIKNTQEILEVQALSARANTVLSGENVVDEFLNIIKKDNLITDNDIDEEYGLFITVDGLEFKIEEENNNVKIIYQGEKDKLTPSIQTCIINNTTNSITVETSGRNINSFNYYIKESEEGEYELKGNNTTGKYAYLDLEQDKTYYIKIEAVNNNGTDVKEYTKTTGTVTAGTEEGAIVFSNVTWNPSTHTASIILSTNTDYTIQYKVSGKITTWTAGTTVSGLVHSDTVYARLFDGTNGGSSASLTIEDNDAPNVTLTQGEVTTNSITVTAGATDDKSGIANNAIYSFYIKKKSDANYPAQAAQSGTSSTFIKTELDQVTEYEIKVEVEDVAGNVGRNSISATTGEVITSSGNITFNPSTTNWTNGDVTVIASTLVTGVIVKISDNINFTNSVAGSTGVTVSVNGTVYARLEDSNGQANGYEPYVVSNIDKNAPTVGSLTSTTGNANSHTLTASTISDVGSGLSHIWFSQINSKPAANASTGTTANTWIANTASSKTFTVTQNGTWYVWVKDVVGNVSEVQSVSVANIVAKVSGQNLTGTTAGIGVTSTGTLSYSGTAKSISYASSNTGVCTVSGTSTTYTITGKTAGTSTITATITNYDNTTVTATATATIVSTPGTASVSPTSWTNGSVTVTLPTLSGYTTRYTTNGTNPTTSSTAYNSTNKFTVSSNCTVKYVFANSQGVSSSGTLIISNIDTTAPTMGSATGSTATGNSGTVTCNTLTDTGGSGLAGIYVSTSSSKPVATASGWIANTATSKTVTVSSNGTYYAWVKDNAGNVSTSAKSCTVSGIVAKVSNLSLTNSSAYVGQTGTGTLSYSGTAKSISYASSNTGVCTVSGTGTTYTITGKAAGTSTITATVTNYDGTTSTKTATATIQNAFEVGKEVTFKNDNFFIIAKDSSKMTLITKYYLNVSCNQENLSLSNAYVKFSWKSYWSSGSWCNANSYLSTYASGVSWYNGVDATNRVLGYGVNLGVTSRFPTYNEAQYLYENYRTIYSGRYTDNSQAMYYWLDRVHPEMYVDFTTGNYWSTSSWTSSGAFNCEGYTDSSTAGCRAVIEVPSSMFSQVSLVN